MLPSAQKHNHLRRDSPQNGPRHSLCQGDWDAFDPPICASFDAGPILYQFLPKDFGSTPTEPAAVRSLSTIPITSSIGRVYEQR